MRLTLNTFMFKVQLDLTILEATTYRHSHVQYGARMLLQLILFIYLIARDKKDNLLMHVLYTIHR
jgi:hypothetical protein